MITFAQRTQRDDGNRSDGQAGCPKPPTCPLSLVRAGMVVRVKRLCAPPEMTRRLREIGFGEQQVIKLLVSQSNLICQVCDARMALSAQLAQLILVEPLPA